MYFVYFVTNKSNSVLYIGVTNSLERRIFEHKNELIEGFTKRYHTHKLVYYEEYSDINTAIAREKQLKKWVRAKKNMLVDAVNPLWQDLFEQQENQCKTFAVCRHSE